MTLTRRQLACWYAGGYRSVTAAQISGVHSQSTKTLTTLIHATTDHEPWLPDHF
ncbi:sterol carrier protein domain-containing protein [Actinacidiphila sp. bgisy160]|uniref:sterol carrier protein domain-containing protein n=1 Tax=Actinacidiphila sp. bgisy160 TaxID=3413796 RepID=UPI003D709C3B